MAIGNASLDAMLAPAPAAAAATTIQGVFAQIVNRRLVDAIAGVGTPVIRVEAAIRQTERLRAFAAEAKAAKAADADADAPLADADADAPHAEAKAPLTADEEWELLLAAEAKAEADEAAASAAWDEALHLLASEAEAAAAAEVTKAIGALASTAVEAVAKAASKVKEAAAYAAKAPAAEVWAKAVATAFAVAEAEAEAVGLAVTLDDASAAAVKVTAALAEVERLRGKAQSAADKARQASASSASAPDPLNGEPPVDGDEEPINPAFAGLAGLLAVAAPVADVVVAPAPVAEPVAAPVAAVAPAPALPVINGLGDIPMPITIRADARIGAVLGALDSVTNGALREALTAPLPGTYREAVARAEAFGAILDRMAQGGKVAVLKTVTVGGRAVAQIAVASIVQWRVSGSDITVVGRARLRDGKVALNGVDTAFAGVLQFDREAVVVDDMELESTDFGFAAPTTSLQVVPVAKATQSNAPRGRSGGRR